MTQEQIKRLMGIEYPVFLFTGQGLLKVKGITKEGDLEVPGIPPVSLQNLVEAEAGMLYAF